MKTMGPRKRGRRSTDTDTESDNENIDPNLDDESPAKKRRKYVTKHGSSLELKDMRARLDEESARRSNFEEKILTALADNGKMYKEVQTDWMALMREKL
jgi:hypothetical protein